MTPDQPPFRPDLPHLTEQNLRTDDRIGRRESGLRRVSQLSLGLGLAALAGTGAVAWTAQQGTAAAGDTATTSLSSRSTTSDDTGDGAGDGGSTPARSWVDDDAPAAAVAPQAKATKTAKAATAATATGTKHRSTTSTQRAAKAPAVSNQPPVATTKQS